MSVGCSFCRERWKSQGWEGHCPHSTPEVLKSEMNRQDERIRTLEAEVAYWQEEARRYAQNADHHQAEADRLRENEYAVLHKGLDLMAWVKVAEAAQARVRELEEKLNKLMQAPPGTIIVPFPL